MQFKVFNIILFFGSIIEKCLKLRETELVILSHNDIYKREISNKKGKQELIQHLISYIFLNSYPKLDITKYLNHNLMLKTFFDYSHIIALFGGLITAFASAFVLYFDDPRLQMRANKKTFAIISVIGGFLTAMAALLSTLQSDADKKTIAELSKLTNNKIDTVSSKSDKLLTKNDTIIILNTKINELSEEIISLSRRISEQSKVIENQITGGLSFPVVTISSLGFNHFSVLVDNRGEFPLHNLNIELFEKEALYTQKRKIRSLSEAFTLAGQYSYHQDFLSQKSGQLYLGDIPIPIGKDSINYFISLKANNGNYYESLILMKDKKNIGNWTWAWIVKEGKKIIAQYKDKRFPHELNTVKWDIDFGLPEGAKIPDSIIDKFYPKKF